MLNQVSTRKPLLPLAKLSDVVDPQARIWPKRPLIVAHRGGSLEGPENTLEALRLSVAGGSDWQEVDVALTADHEPVILHDDTLFRTTGAQGDISTWKAADVFKLKAGNPQFDGEVQATMRQHGVDKVPSFAGRFPNARVPSLAEVLALPKSRLMLELKATPKPGLMADKVVGAIDAAEAWSRVAVASFDVEILQEVHARAPYLPRIGLAEDMDQVHAMLREQVNILGVGLGLVRESARQLPPKVALWAWTVYTESMARKAIADGAHAVIADNPVALRQALERRPINARL